MPTTHLKTAGLRLLLLYGITSFLLMAAGGCRSGRDNQIDLLERELRSQEDYIYELEDYVVEYSEKLRDFRCTTPHETIHYSKPQSSSSANHHQSKRAKRAAEQAEVVDLDEEEMVELDEPLPDEEEIEEESAPPERIIPEELDIPELEIGGPVGQTEPVDPFSEVSLAAYEEEAQATRQQIFIPDPALFEAAALAESQSALFESGAEIETQSTLFEAGAETDSQSDEEFSRELFGDSEESIEAAVEIPAGKFAEDSIPERTVLEDESTFADRTAEQLVVTQLFRSGGELAAPSSLLIVVEARDAYDEPVDLNGEVSLMVMTADAHSPQRLHRWDFTREETSTAWQSSELGDGLHMELPLAETLLPSKSLEIWVRLVTQDGRKLLTQLPFETRELVAIDAETTDAETTDAETTDEETTDEATATASEELPLEKSLLAENVEGERRLPRLAQEKKPAANILRQGAAASKKEKPRWRASMQRTHTLTEGFSTTSRGKQRWSPQSGNRAAVAVRQTTTVEPAKQKSSWNTTDVPKQTPKPGSSPKWEPYR